MSDNPTNPRFYIRLCTDCIHASVYLPGELAGCAKKSRLFLDERAIRFARRCRDYKKVGEENADQIT